ncbi:MAG: DUF6122 family protein [Bacteroidota bacterium]
MLRLFIHYGIHFIVPFLIAFLVFKKQQWKVLAIFLLGMVIDVDHLLAEPIFDPNRCSIGFHPLHSYVAIAVYVGLSIWSKTRLIGFSLSLHILADTADCILMRAIP